MVELLQDLREHVSDEAQSRIDDMLASVRLLVVIMVGLLTKSRLSKMLRMPLLAYKGVPVPTKTRKRKETRMKIKKSQMRVPTWAVLQTYTYWTKTECRRREHLLEASVVEHST
jgi:hypothetical protein